jgi:TM2 domain-containing membrane protein YozV
MSRYYVADGMVQRGPFEMSDLPGQGLRGDTLVWKEGMEQWRRADEVEELIFAGALPRPAAVPAPTLPPVPGYGYRPAPVGPAYPAVPPTNRIAAGVLGILLGALGIHKFVLGRVGAGLVMLLVTLLTCGWGGIVMNVIGIIEGIIYLTRSEEQFYWEYVVGKKSWF